jgi:2-polyprenyl-6-methoxyphenol hydroxylase-like FAD-dependent oxidoreductase
MLSPPRIYTSCCIVGGGPAGVMLGYLLARAHVPVVVLEKHGDFLRDFRGDTVHPSTLDVLYELGLLDKVLARPHQKVSTIGGSVGGHPVTIADFGHTPTHCHFIALMPQWDFLDCLTEEAAKFPAWQLKMNAEVIDLIKDKGRVVGVRAQTPEGEVDIRAHLVVGADGRSSVLRERAELEVMEMGVPIDVLWMRLSKQPEDPPQTMGFFDHGRGFIMLDRGDYWQCGFIIRKGELSEIQARGLPAFRDELTRLVPALAGRGEEIHDWSAVKLLTVKIDRLAQWWKPGLLCIGDAAHAMSPVGGVGINLAIQDAVAAANLLAIPLRRRHVTDHDLAAVEHRRLFPTRVTQELQRFLHEHIWPEHARDTSHRMDLPAPLALLSRFPALQRIPARIVGVGVRPEHVHTPG